MSNKINSFIWFLKKVCADYQFMKQEDEDYIKLSAPKLAEMASYHWSHMSDLEKQPYIDAAKRNQQPKIEMDKNSSFDRICRWKW
ncbi:hypothetical protein PVAND_006355 [Polypedilum vanderplanki]|uniref:Uncharacterized protein n=1 Tax=Polypedilum vanderplanki TaxID=319348 RepID=A0A9J6C3D4_POLVA|nr:hypothetical protein PVAND_006355 [Polypedilum vanderplanki]